MTDLKMKSTTLVNCLLLISIVGSCLAIPVRDARETLGQLEEAAELANLESIIAKLKGITGGLPIGGGLPGIGRKKRDGVLGGATGGLGEVIPLNQVMGLVNGLLGGLLGGRRKRSADFDDDYAANDFEY